MADAKPPKDSKKEVANSAAQGAAEGASSGANNVSVSRVEQDKDRASELKKNVQNGNLQKGVINKAKDAQHGKVDAQDAKNIAKGGVQYAQGDMAGLAETASDEANKVSDEQQQKKDNKKDKAKDAIGTLNTNAPESKKDASSKKDANKDAKSKKDESDSSPKGPVAGDAPVEEKKVSSADEDKKKEDNAFKNLKDMKTKAKIAGAATSVGLKGFMLLQVANFFKMLLLLLSQLAQAIVAAVAAVVAAVVHAAAVVAVAIGVSIAIALTGIAGVFVAGVVLALGTYTMVSQELTMAHREGYLAPYDDDEDEDPCEGKAPVFVPEEPTSTEEENMHKVYSVMSTIGFSDEAIAGIFGNFAHEGGLDSTKIEGLYVEDYTYGVRHMAIMEPIAAYHTYSANKANGNQGYYWEGKAWCGLGIGQWTASRAKFLLEYADTLDGPEGYEWYDLETQLAYMFSKDTGKVFFDGWLANMPTNPQDAAEDYCRHWMVPANIEREVAERRAASAVAFIRIAGWEADVDYANTIIDLAKMAHGEAGDESNRDLTANGCIEGPVYTYGATLAERMVAYCWPTKDESRLNNGTDLYVAVHDAVYPGDPLYMSCDRSVACAVRWSGVDDSYPVGNTTTQYDYLFEHPEKWQQITAFSWGDWNTAITVLLPGDIIICPNRVRPGRTSHGHTVMFLGNELIRETYPNTPNDPLYCIGSGAFEERSPACSRPSFDDSRSAEYVAFRAISKEANPKYVDILNP